MEKRTFRTEAFQRLTALAPLIAFEALLCALAMSLAAKPASGGVVLAPPMPAPEAPGPGENYPESSFGKAPYRANGRPNVSSNSAARAADDIDREVSFGGAGGNRRPAGYQFSDGSAVGDTTSQSAGFSGGDRSDRNSRGLEPLTVVRRGVQEVSLIAGDLGFFPKTIFATRDVPVRLYVTGASKNTLCIMMDSFQVRRQVKQARIEEITFTPGSAGKYRFYCPVNGMEGNLVVRELGSFEKVEDSVAQSQAAPVRAQEAAPEVQEREGESNHDLFRRPSAAHEGNRE